MYVHQSTYLNPARRISSVGNSSVCMCQMPGICRSKARHCHGMHRKRCIGARGVHWATQHQVIQDKSGTGTPRYNKVGETHLILPACHSFLRFSSLLLLPSRRGFEAIPGHLTGGQDGCRSTHVRIISTMRTAGHQAHGLKHTIPVTLNAERKG
ncbi:hypothetical protein QR685DRAFT_264092 [Neurospora intermedia]|uniref:Uncharacterized protein n=1 Tax=Neurospora intermedia TaxID=5142 RepID=A0ABR3DDM4_NEUIN